MRDTTSSTGIKKSADQTALKMGRDCTFEEWVRSGISSTSALFFVSIALLGPPLQLLSQESGSSRRLIAAAELPEAPQPQFVVATNAPSDPQDQSTQQPAPSTNAQDSSSSQSVPQQPDAKRASTKRLKSRSRSRRSSGSWAFCPQFNVSYRSDAVSMTAGQKMKLAFRSSDRPGGLCRGFVIAGYHEAQGRRYWDSDGESKGFGKRAGAAYLDAFDGTMIGNGILPSILHQDPATSAGPRNHHARLLYSACHQRHLQARQYRQVGAQLLQRRRQHYRGRDLQSLLSFQQLRHRPDLRNGFIVTAEGGIGSIFDEFWPDISRKFLHRIQPRHRCPASRAGRGRKASEAEPEIGRVKPTV
jgi:hypothetical protein